MISFYSRFLNESTGESRFFAQTVNTATTVPHVLGVCRKHLQTPEPLTESQDLNAQIEISICPDFMCLILFERDLESHPGIVDCDGKIFTEGQSLWLTARQDLSKHPA